MCSLFLNKTEKTKLSAALDTMEMRNGTAVYWNDEIVLSYRCKHWDCFISCNCANSRD